MHRIENLRNTESSTNTANSKLQGICMSCPESVLDVPNSVMTEKERDLSYFSSSNVSLSNKNSDIYKASDGKEYNIRDIILNRLNNLITIFQKQSKVHLMEKTQKEYDKVENTKDIKQAFKSLTGMDYIPQNVEKFLKGHNFLNLEKEAAKEKQNKTTKVSNPPFINENYNTNSEKLRLQKQRKILNDKEKTLYAKIYGSLNNEMKIKFEKCLKSGKLLQSNTNDNSTVLDNLYKIFSTERAREVDKNNLMNECINILYNPYVITQKTEDIPDDYIDKTAQYVFDQEEKLRLERKEIARHSAYMRLLPDETKENEANKEEKLKRIKKELNERAVGTCVAASIEFVFASQYPSEFFRIVEGLTSKNKEVKKTINLKNADLTEFDIKIFKTKHKMKNENIELTFKADEGAYILADMQKKCQDNDERTTIDILFQSMIFQISTQNSYNSISDKHFSFFSEEKDGIGSLEEEYTLKVLTGRMLNSVIYRACDESSFITSKDELNEVQRDVEKELARGKYVIIGINCSDSQDTVDGHEITIIDKIKGMDGIEYYICKDTDEPEAHPCVIRKDCILSRTLNISVIK